MKSPLFTLCFCVLSISAFSQNLDKLHKQAERGNLKAISELVDHYMLDFNREKSVYYMEKGEALGEKPMHHGLRAGCYFYEEGRAKDPEKAARWAKKAYEGGDPLGTLLLGLMKMMGDGVDQDMEGAIALIKKSKEMGSPFAAAVWEDMLAQFGGKDE